MAYLLQSSIIFAVMASNIRWHWTPNGYVAGLIAACAAYGATVLLSYLGSLFPFKRTGDSRHTAPIHGRALPDVLSNGYCRTPRTRNLTSGRSKTTNLLFSCGVSAPANTVLGSGVLRA